MVYNEVDFFHLQFYSLHITTTSNLYSVFHHSFIMNNFLFCFGLFHREGQAIWMDENIRYGKTDRCLTFNNPPLCPSGDFEIRVLEVYGFAGA